VQARRRRGARSAAAPAQPPADQARRKVR
jgi:hypothetical protein